MPPFSGMRCLVVDDEPRLRRVLVRLLEGEGFACAEAGSGVEALQELEKGAVPLVISDLRMPEMDGVTLLREIISRWPETAVIVVTAVAEVESAVACLQMGALDYVAKPFHLDEVRARELHRDGTASPRNPGHPSAGTRRRSRPRPPRSPRSPPSRASGR